MALSRWLVGTAALSAALWDTCAFPLSVDGSATPQARTIAELEQPILLDDVEADLVAKLHGCTGVFIDAGANIGMHARFLFEPELYPKAKYTSLFSQWFGPASDRSGACAVEFEPNPAQTPRLEKLAAAYATRGWRVVVAPYGVSDRRGTLTFYHNDHGKHEEWTFATHRGSKWYRLGLSSTPVKVPTIDFARFLQLLTAERSVARPVVVKMDIEGSEFQVLPHMIARNVLCTAVDSITLEFHQRYAVMRPLNFKLVPDSTIEISSMADGTKVQKLLSAMVRDAGMSPDCRTKFLDPLDDEEYLKDRSPEQEKNPTPAAPAGIWEEEGEYGEDGADGEDGEDGEDGARIAKST